LAIKKAYGKGKRQVKWRGGGEKFDLIQASPKKVPMERKSETGASLRRKWSLRRVGPTRVLGQNGTKGNLATDRVRTALQRTNTTAEKTKSAIPPVKCSKKKPKPPAGKLL